MHRPNTPRSFVGVVALALVSVILAPLNALAHDYWLEPSIERIDGGGARVVGHLWVGEALVAEMERGPERARVEALRIIAADATDDRTSSLADSTEPPFVALDLPTDAPRLVHVRRGFTRIELPPDRFDAYLRSEGLLRAFRERRRLGESARPGRERYARRVSALVTPSTQPVPEAVYAADTECPIAIVPSRDPSSVRAGGALSFLVRFRGEPLADAAVDLVQRDARGRVRAVRARTDRRGRATVRVPSTGFAVLRTVTMVRAEVDDADWESWWTSYSFTNR